MRAIRNSNTNNRQNNQIDIVNFLAKLYVTNNEKSEQIDNNKNDPICRISEERLIHTKNKPY